MTARNLDQARAPRLASVHGHRPKPRLQSTAHHRKVAPTRTNLARGLMALGQSVKMNIKGEERAGRKFCYMLFNQQTVGAQINKALSVKKLLNYGMNIRMEQRFAAGDGHDWSTAFFGCTDTFINAEMPFHNFFRLVDLAASPAV